MSITARLAARPHGVRRAVIAVVLVATAAAAYLAVEFSFSDPNLAAWWPAAGLATFAAMLARGRERWLVIGLVVVATGSGNLLAGRDLPVAILFGLGDTVEVIILAALLAPKGVVSRLATLRQATRFVAVASAAAAASGLALASVAAVALQRPFVEGFAQLTASHASATLVMLPLVLVPIAAGRGVRRTEIVVQSLFLMALVAAVFWPGNYWPLAFVPLVAFLWAALRFPILVVATQVVLTAVAVIVLTFLGGGPFAVFDEGSRTTVVLIQLFVLVYAVMALVVCSARADWFALVARLRAQEALLREGIVTADVGIIIAERTDEGEVREVTRNDRARRAVGHAELPFDRAAIDEVLSSGASQRIAFTRDDRSYEATMTARTSADGPPLVAVVITDVTERDERERLALDSAERLRHLNAQKDDFISAVSHELRTPVTSILGFSEQLVETPLTDEGAQAGAIIARNARRLAAVIDDVLELSELSALGGPATAPVPVDLAELAAHCAGDAEGLALHRRVTVRVDASAGPVVVHSRPRDLERVCANLLSNAVKFSHDEGEVTIEVRPADNGEGALVRVIDRGLGLPAEFHEMVWQRFARAPVDEHRLVPGTGLGLPIVKGLVTDRLGGEVSLADTPEGGVTVTVYLPEVAPGVSSQYVGA